MDQGFPSYQRINSSRRRAIISPRWRHIWCPQGSLLGPFNSIFTSTIYLTMSNTHSQACLMTKAWWAETSNQKEMKNSSKAISIVSNSGKAHGRWSSTRTNASTSAWPTRKKPLKTSYKLHCQTIKQVKTPSPSGSPWTTISHGMITSIK